MRRLAFLTERDNPPKSIRSMEETTRRLGLSFLLAEHTVTDLQVPSTSYTGNALTPCM